MAKQDDRLMKIFTPLGEDFLLINKFTAKEAISELFEYEIELLHEENDDALVATDVDPRDILGKGVAIAIMQRDGTSRFFSGMVSSFSRGHRSTRYTYYFATVVPHVWLLTQTSQSRIFQRMNVPDILNEVLSSFEVEVQLQRTYKPRNYCVQYRETDFNFISRLMEEEGIYYYFEHLDDKHKMIIADSTKSHSDLPTKSTISYSTEVGRQDDFVASIRDLWIDTRVQTGKVTLWDYNFQVPNDKLSREQPSIFTVGDNQKLEHYDFPGGYARKYDGIDSSGGESASNLSPVHNDKESTAESMMNALDCGYEILSGVSDCSSLTAGHRFKLTDHPNDDRNGKFIVTSVTHEAEQNPSYVSDEFVEEPYSNSFTCIRHGEGAPPYAPPRKTRKPVIEGAQTAFVVGPAGEEIFTDKFGRVKVQFHWDRHGQVNADSSCWVRVAQGWASNRWGMMFIPRIGMEVLVHFLEGDPDQPIITGCVYNPQTMPPYTLPDEKTKSTIKSNSTVGGGGFNEFRFEDKKGSEQIFIHAEKDQDIRVKNDCKELIKHDRHLIVENDQFEKVNKDKHLKVVGEHNEKVDQTISVEAGMDFLEKAGMKFAVDAGNEIHLKSGMSMTLETGTNLTLKVGGNFININPGGIFVSGTMIMLNSGGAAGSGSGCSPQTPQAAQEAANADPGQDVAPIRPPSPPPFPGYTTLAAVALSRAAGSGTAFCDL